MTSKTVARMLIFVILAVPTVQGLSFTEDFESYTTTGFKIQTKPDQDWYTYTEGDDVGTISSDPPVIAGSNSFHVRTAGGGTSAQKSTFTLAGPTQLSDFSFSIHGTTIADNGVGSRQVVAIQSSAPIRTMVEFYLFCTDAANPTGCDLRVRFDNIDTTGQVLVNTTAGDQSFDIQILPDWTTGTYQLFVDAVDDGVFPFLELPDHIGRIQMRQHNSAYPLNLTFDDWFIDGAVEASPTQAGDIAGGLKNFATAIQFTSTGSLFLLGLVFLAIIVLAVAIPTVSLGKDNTTLPALTFFTGLAVLWMVTLEWWPDWVGIAMIILVAALVSMVVRRLLMGIRDASTNAGIVAGALGYFIIATSLLGFSGYATESIEVPTSSLTTPEDDEAQSNMSAPQQSFVGAVAECVITFFSDCSTKTESTIWATITDVASTIFNFARTAFTFLFQLLTFSLPIPVIFNVVIVLPPAAALATVGFSFITRSGS